MELSSTKEVNSEETVDLDEILEEFGLGPYQIIICVLMGFVLMYSNISPLSYAITASDLKYRCEIPQCDNADSLYNPDWLQSAVPFKSNSKEPQKCLRYHHSAAQNDSGSDTTVNNTCIPEAFDVNFKEKCDQWVFGETELTIVNDFGIMCEENKWKLSLVGTVNSFGQFIGIPVSGLLSDKYGRKVIMITGSVCSAILGTIRSFTTDYNTFLIFEFSDSLISSGIYSATLILGLEIVSPKARNTVSALMGCFYPIGSVIMGFTAYILLDWRMLLRTLYLPGLLIFGYIWYVPESIRWLQTQKRNKEVATILSKIAKSNGKTLPPSINEALSANRDDNNISKTPKMSKISYTINVIKQIFTTKEIFLRLVNCSFCWITITLVYYGLSLSSVELSDDKYYNFILVNAVEIPSFVMSWYLMEHLPRRHTQAFSFFASGVGCILVNVTPADYFKMRLLSFLASKFSICIAFNAMYVFTAEMFPTELRMSLIGVTSMFGRLGSMIAPQMTLLSTYFGPNVPILLFGIVSFMAGALALLFPETKDKKLPDTVNDTQFVREVKNDSPTDVL